ncbi:MAG: ABC transporter permease [Firmicutes bacterium]|nr:ABC transporter permease [Bacillota bacterium]
MDLVWEGLRKAVQMLIQGEPEVYQIAGLTLRLAGTSTLISVLVGVPLGSLIALGSFPGRRLLATVMNVGMGLPPVVAGLWVTLLLWRSGPFGRWALLYTPAAIVIAQVLVALPILASLTASALQQLDPRLAMQVRALGASRWQTHLVLLWEARLGILAAVIAGLGRVLAEVGASMMVGGNIRGETRILTTAMVLEVSRGQFDVAIALSFILMALAFVITGALTWLQQRERQL